MKTGRCRGWCGRRRGIVVDDCACALRPRQGSVGRTAEIDGKGFVRLNLSVADDIDGDSAAGLAGVDGQGLRRSDGLIIRAGGGCAVGGGVLHRDILGTGAGERDGEVSWGHAAIAFGDSHIVNGQRGLCFIVGDGQYGGNGCA